jgi:hypothetical protein
VEKRVRDATWLFEKHNKSEHWWSAAFALVMASLSKHGSPTEFPLWKYRGDQKWFEPLKDIPFSFRGITLSQIHVEAKLSAVFKEELPKSNVEPDLIVADRHRRIATIIENKTLHAPPGDLKAYCDAAKQLKDLGWDARTLLLISAGHPNDDIWQEVERLDLRILLWEDALRAMDRVPWLAELFDEDLSGYYLRREIRDC